MNDEERNADRANLANLLDFLDETPNTLARLTDGLLAAELCSGNSDEEFSALEKS